MIFFSYFTTLGSLSVIVLIRNKLGQNLFLPWAKVSDNPFTRVVMRYWMLVLLFFWVRCFFFLEVIHSDNPIKDNIWVLFFGFTFDYGFSGDLILYYYSYIVVILGVFHIVAIEKYYANKEAISESYLGESILFGWTENQKIADRTVDDIFIWGAIEPIAVAAFGIILQGVFDLIFTGFFLEISALAMFIQGQSKRLESRQRNQKIINAQATNDSLKSKREGFNEKRESGESNKNTGHDGGGGASFA